MTNQIQVGILMGSDSDLPTMLEAKKILDEFGIGNEVKILSAHRTPLQACDYAQKAIGRGVKVIIAGAGMANHLAGAMAANTVIPIIGVPLDGSPLNGMDALLSTVQMPAGIPVGCVAIGKAGAKNAAHYALQILGLLDPVLQKKIAQSRESNAQVLLKKNETL